MNYTQAKAQLGAEKVVTRKAFAEGEFIFHGHPFVQIYLPDEGGIVQAHNASSHYNLPYKSGGILCKKTAKNIEVGWSPTKKDLEADDWEVVEVK